MAHDLSSDDLRLALKLESGTLHHMISLNVFLGSMILAIGIAVLLVGVGLRLPPVGVAGYLLMCAGAYCAVDRRWPRRPAR